VNRATTEDDTAVAHHRVACNCRSGLAHKTSRAQTLLRVRLLLIHAWYVSMLRSGCLPVTGAFTEETQKADVTIGTSPTCEEPLLGEAPSLRTP
jgi:hypothetical protein